MSFAHHSALRRPLLFTGLIISFLAGCSQQEMSDLESYVATIKAKKNPHVDPIPEIEQVIPYYYEVQYMRDPFISLDAETKQQQEVTEVNLSLTTGESKKKICPQPGAHRIRVGLELIPLYAMELKGTLEINGQLWALITLHNDNTIAYRVKQGDFLGDSYGEITNISEEQIEVLEQKADEQGCWHPAEEPTVISLNEE
jgi:type IV pilus assembly protein PilP